MNIGRSRRRGFEQSFELHSGFLELATLEQGQGKIEAQPRHLGIHSQGLAIKGNGLGIAFLPGCKQT